MYGSLPNSLTKEKENQIIIIIKYIQNKFTNTFAIYIRFRTAARNLRHHKRYLPPTPTLSVGLGGYGALGVGHVLAGGLTVEDETRVAEAEEDGGHENEAALEGDEGTLVVHDVAGVPVLELGHAVGAAGEDEDDGAEEADEEGLHPPAEGLHAARPPVADHVVGEDCDEGHQDDDLQDQTGHGDVDAGVVGAVGVGRQGTARGLQDQADDIGGDEDPVEELGLEA